MTEFSHVHTAHCESGVTVALLGARGLQLSEPMAFGIGGGLFFFFPPFLKVMGMPLISYRTFPGTIFKKACKRLGVTTELKRYSSESKGVEALDRFLEEGTPVGLQANMYWLPYFPKEFRSQFNGHNLVALKREGERYQLSDPMLQETTWLEADTLTRARFSKGILAPKGCTYRPLRMPRQVDLSRAICAGVKGTAKGMLSKAPPVGTKGIRRLAKHVRNWGRQTNNQRKSLLLLGHVIRMQEEVGTGGAGFRYLYAAFLQEAGEYLDHAPFLAASKAMTEIGDLWRNCFAVTCGRIIKDRLRSGDGFDSAADILMQIASAEEELYRALLTNLPARKAHSITPITLGAAS